MFKSGIRGLRRIAVVLGFLTMVIFSGTSARTNKQTGLVLPHVTNMMAIYGADVVTIDRNARDFKLPDQFEFKNAEKGASKTATLFGDPSKPGLYVQVTRRGPTEWSQPDSHPNERFITVLA